MSFARFSIFLGWTLLMVIVTCVLLLLYTFGDCFDDARCVAYKQRASWFVIGGGFVTYWSVAALLFRRWSR